MLARLVAGALLVALLGQAQAFQKGEEIFLPSGVWVCYEPAYLEQSIRVYEKTRSLQIAEMVLKKTSQCTKVMADASYTIKERVKVIPVTVDGNRQRYEILRINFNGGVDIFFGAVDPRQVQA